MDAQTDKHTIFRKALAKATTAHGAENSFGAQELYVEHSAPHPNWQRQWDRIIFHSEDREHTYTATKFYNKSPRHLRWQVTETK
jgi:hypothetical protein